MTVRAISAALLVLPACFGKPSFQGALDDAGSGMLAGVSVAGNGQSDDMTVTTADLLLRFPRSPINLPDQLQIGGVEVLDEQDGCGYENKIGLAVYPVYAMTTGTQTWPTATGDTHTSSLAQLATGPAFAQARVSWSGTFHCASTPSTVSGSSTFTIFPDGRIIRDDQITSPTSVALASVNCGCGSASGSYFLTSYLSLLTQRFSHLTYDAIPTGTPAPVEAAFAALVDGNSVDAPNPRWACLENRNASAQRRIGVAWGGNVPATTGDGGTRIKLDIVGQPTPSATLIYDWANDATTLGTTARDVQVAWFVAAGAGASCDAVTMGDLFGAFATPRRLAVDKGVGAVMVPLDVHTGIYTVGGAAAASYSIQVETALSGVPGGMAISLPFPTATALVVTRDGTRLVENNDYLIQHAGSPVVFSLWFPNGLAQQQTLVITQP